MKDKPNHKGSKPLSPPAKRPQTLDTPRIVYGKIGKLPPEMNRKNLMLFLRYEYPDCAWSENMKFEVVMDTDKYYIREMSSPQLCAMFDRTRFFQFVTTNNRQR